MRIGITCFPTAGGSGVVATELGKSLAKRGHQVAFISYSPPLRLGDTPSGVTFHPVRSMQYPLLKEFPHTLTLASTMATVAREKRLQILHVHYAIPFAPAALLAQQIAPELGLRIVTTLHGTDVTLVGNDPAFKPITTMVIAQSDAVTAVSRWLREQAAQEFMTGKPVRVIYNFVDPNRYRRPKGLLPAAAIGQSPYTLVHISNFRPVKRIVDVIKIFAKVQQQVDARLVLVGDGPESCRALQTALDCGIADRVQFVGLVEDTAPILQNSDLLLLPSQTESFGLVALEAMASGVPVIASDVGGLPEVVAHGECGFLAPVGDVEQMAAYAVKLLTDPPLYRAFSEAAQKRAESCFHPDQIVPQYEALYQELLTL